MKKRYITPNVQYVEIASGRLFLTGSLNDETAGGSEAMSQSYQSGLLWEDDNNEAE